MRTNIVTSKAGAKVIEPRRTIIDVVPFVGWVKEYVGRFDPAAMPEIAKQWKDLQSGLAPCSTEFEDLILTQECAN
jgi:hypothetical protein